MAESLSRIACSRSSFGMGIAGVSIVAMCVLYVYG